MCSFQRSLCPQCQLLTKRAPPGLPTLEHRGLRLRDQPHGLDLQRRRHLLRLGQVDRRPRQLRPDQRPAGGVLHRVASQGWRCRLTWGWCWGYTSSACGTRSTRGTRGLSCYCCAWPKSMQIKNSSSNNNSIERPASRYLVKLQSRRVPANRRRVILGEALEIVTSASADVYITCWARVSTVQGYTTWADTKETDFQAL